MTTSPQALLARARRIAVVGMSDDPTKAAHRVPLDLHRAGFTVIPVNPRHEHILGLRCRPSLADVPGPIDIVDVFRPGPECAAVARDAVAAGATALWLQLGITSAEARAIATDAGIDYVEDTCILVVRREHGITVDGSSMR